MLRDSQLPPCEPPDFSEIKYYLVLRNEDLTLSFEKSKFLTLYYDSFDTAMHCKVSFI